MTKASKHESKSNLGRKIAIGAGTAVAAGGLVLSGNLLPHNEDSASADYLREPERNAAIRAVSLGFSERLVDEANRRQREHDTQAPGRFDFESSSSKDRGKLSFTVEKNGRKITLETQARLNSSHDYDVNKEEPEVGAFAGRPSSSGTSIEGVDYIENAGRTEQWSVVVYDEPEVASDKGALSAIAAITGGALASVDALKLTEQLAQNKFTNLMAEAGIPDKE